MIVPTLVKLEPVIVELSELPLSVLASAIAVIVISEDPSNETPLIFLAVANLVAVAALPVTFPVTFPVRSPVTFPDIVAVIVPALKFPLASLATMELAVFALVAVVALFDTLPAVAIVASFVSAIAALGLMSALTI